MAAGLAISMTGTAWAQENASQDTQGSEGPPNILVIWGDDIGWSNLSA
ncbi:hypothetical protein [Halomonas halophila]